MLPGVISGSSPSSGTSQAILLLLLQAGGGGGNISSNESSENLSSSASSLNGRKDASGSCSISLDDKFSSLSLLLRTSRCLSMTVGTVLGGTLVGDVIGCDDGKLPNLYAGAGCRRNCFG